MNEIKLNRKKYIKFGKLVEMSRNVIQKDDDFINEYMLTIEYTDRSRETYKYSSTTNKISYDMIDKVVSFTVKDKNIVDIEAAQIDRLLDNELKHKKIYSFQEGAFMTFWALFGVSAVFMISPNLYHYANSDIVSIDELRNGIALINAFFYIAVILWGCVSFPLRNKNRRKYNKAIDEMKLKARTLFDNAQKFFKEA